MPTYGNIPELLMRIVGDVTSNGANQIDGERLRDLLVDTVKSLDDILGSVPPSTVATFLPWDGTEAYTGGTEVVVQYGGKLYLFVSADDNTGTEPGTNALVWEEFSALQLAHFRNKDQYLDQGGPYQMSAQQIYALQRFGYSTVLFVSATIGDDATGQRGKMFYPYKTLNAAYVASLAGDTIIIVGPGTYTLSYIIGHSLTVLAEQATINAASAALGGLMAENAPTVVKVKALLVNAVRVQENAHLYVEADVTGDVRGQGVTAGNVDVTGTVGSVSSTLATSNVTIRGRVLGTVTQSNGTITINGRVSGITTKTGGNLVLNGGPFGKVTARDAGQILAINAYIDAVLYSGTGANPALLAKGCSFGNVVDAATVYIDPASVANVGMSSTAGASEAYVDDAVAAHVAEPDPHAQYQKEAEKGAANGYAALDGTGKVPADQLPTAGTTVNSTDILDASAPGRDLLTAADVADQRAALELGTAALSDDSDFDPAGAAAFVNTSLSGSLALKAPLDSPELTGTPTAPTQTPGDSSPKIATTHYVDIAVAQNSDAWGTAIYIATAGLVDDRGDYDASVNAWPSSGGSGASGAILTGDQWEISVAGTLGSGIVNPGDIIRARSDGPGTTEAYWYVDAAVQPSAITEAQLPTTTDDTSYMTPVKVWQSINKSVTTASWKSLVMAAMGITGNFHARLDQTGTAAPAFSSAVGTMVSDITITRSGVGSYVVTSASGAFGSKTDVQATNGLAGSSSDVRASQINATTIGIRTYVSDVLTDGVLTKCSIDITQWA